MAHFARLNDQNKVTQVVVVNNDVATDEAAGVAFLKNIYGQNTIWKQTSYNTQRGVHLLGGTPFRKNFAGIDMNYDEGRDAFVPDQPFPSWTLNEDTCVWDAPVPYKNPEALHPVTLWDEEAYQADTNDPKTAGWLD
jgi:hypothetical protein|tara:strand:+ start:1508 stop:1918 length:411 start_codon:yes stop_codon:yes gene_type:complete